MQKKIRVLWAVNIELPNIENDVNNQNINFGGWISNMAEFFKANMDYQLTIAMRSSGKFRVIEKDSITYICLPQKRNNKFDVPSKYIAKTIQISNPDILHCEGSEMEYTQKFAKQFVGPKILSMQGILAGYQRHEMGSINLKKTLFQMSFSSLISYILLWVNSNIFFTKRVSIENKTFRLFKNVIGRTSWDKAYAKYLNPNARYFSSNRILRKQFYKNMWSENLAKKYTIFVGNISHQRKGGLILADAIEILKKDYPNIKVKFAGPKKDKSLKNYFSFDNYLSGYIKSKNLSENFIFLGQLDGDQMVKEFKEASVAVIPSLIENSPNTLAEAMMLGVPTVCSYAGGSPSMSEDEKEVLFYRAEDPVMLSYQIRRVFEDKSLRQKLSTNSRHRARTNHDPETNFTKLIQAYKKVMQ